MLKLEISCRALTSIGFSNSKTLRCISYNVRNIVYIFIMAETKIGLLRIATADILILNGIWIKEHSS